MLTNQVRRELLSKMRQSGFPGSILDVYSAYEQGRDLIDEFTQQQKQAETQRMSDMAAQQSGLSQPEQMQQPQPQQLPSMPPGIPGASLPKPPEPRNQNLVQSQLPQPIGMSTNKQGEKSGQFLFAKGGFKTDPPQNIQVGNPDENRLYTYKNDPEWFDNRSVYNTNLKYNDQIRRAVYSGNYGYNPVTGVLEKLPTNQRTKVDAETKRREAEGENKKAYNESIVAAGFNPETFAKPTAEEEKAYQDRILKDYIIQGHNLAINNPAFKAAAYFTPAGMAIGALEGAAHFIPDAKRLIENPSWQNAGAVGMDALMSLPLTKGLKYISPVNRELQRIKLEGIKAGKNEFEIAKDQLEKVGITSNQRKGYVPGVSEFLSKYVTPINYGGDAGKTKLREILENIKVGGWKNKISQYSTPTRIESRGDAWRMYLGMPQEYGTFRLANTAPVMNPAYKPGSLKGMDIYNIPEEKIFESGFDEVRPQGIERALEPLDNPVILDRDQVIMGGYHKILTKDGLQYNDIWDLDPALQISKLIPKKIQNILPESFLYKPSPTNSGFSQFVQTPRVIKFPVSKFIGKPFMSHGNLPYTSNDYVFDLKAALKDKLGIIAPEGGSAMIETGTPSTNIRFQRALNIEKQLDKLNSGEYPKYKKGGFKDCYTCSRLKKYLKK